jgi:hypothetical protein
MQSLLGVTQRGQTAVTIEFSSVSDVLKAVLHAIGEVNFLDDKQER